MGWVFVLLIYDDDLSFMGCRMSRFDLFSLFNSLVLTHDMPRKLVDGILTLSII